jgi:hypothetical protein
MEAGGNSDKNATKIAIEAEMLDASARMTIKELLDGKSEDYARGFQDGYSLCQELAGLLNSMFSRKK